MLESVKAMHSQLKDCLLIYDWGNMLTWQSVNARPVCRARILSGAGCSRCLWGVGCLRMLNKDADKAAPLPVCLLRTRIASFKAALVNVTIGALPSALLPISDLLGAGAISST